MLRLVSRLAGFALALTAGASLAGCGALNTALSGTIADAMPHWAGGLPPDAPPRPGDPKYEDYERERQAKVLAPSPVSPILSPQVRPQSAPSTGPAAAPAEPVK